MAIKVLIIDHQPLYIEGIVSCLSGDPRFKFVGHAASGGEALEIIAEASPDVIVFDVDLPIVSGLISGPAVIAKLRETKPAIKVIIVTANQDVDTVQSSFAHGAAAYILKDVGCKDLVETIMAVQRGQLLISTGLAAPALSGRKVPSPPKDSLAGILTNREKETLGLVAAGLTSRDIGRRMRISVRTVETHRSRLIRKLKVKNSAGLLRRAIMLGLLKLPRLP